MATFTIKLIGAALTAFLTSLFGGLDALLTVLLWLIAIDYLTGVINAIIDHKLSSEVGYKGIAKKIGILAVVAVAHLIGNAVGMPEIRGLAIGFYIANEGISILENVGKNGTIIPKKLLDILEQLRDKDDKK